MMPQDILAHHALNKDLPNTDQQEMNANTDQKEMKPLMEDKTSDSSDNVTFQGTEGVNQEGDICGIPVDKMTPEIANTLHSIEARRSGGIIQSGGLAAQAQSAAARNVAQGKVVDLPPEEVLGEVPLEKMTPEIASTLQSLEARRHGGVVEPGSLASQALSAASRNVQESGETLGGIPVERITPELASILQSIEARRSGGFIEPGGLAAQAQAIARRNVNQGIINENTMLRPEDLDLSQIVPEMASALQSLEARHTGGYVEPGGLASQALSASRRNSLGDQGTGSRRNSVNEQSNEVGGLPLPLDKMTPEIANTLHSIEARRSGGVISSGGPAAIAQSAAARNVAQGIITDNTEIPPEDVLGSIPMEKMTPEIASALQSLEARRNGGFVQPGGLASQARSAAQRNLNKSQGGTPPQRSRSTSQSSSNGQQDDGGFSQGGRQRGRLMWVPKSPDQDNTKQENMGQLNLEDSNDMRLKNDMASQNQESQSITTGKLE